MRIAMAKSARKPKLRTFHATLVVTRTEEWCVEAETADEARALLVAGQGDRCHSGERLHLEVGKLEDAA
jgi:hypothetical protein